MNYRWWNHNFIYQGHYDFLWIIFFFKCPRIPRELSGTEAIDCQENVGSDSIKINLKVNRYTPYPFTNLFTTSHFLSISPSAFSNLLHQTQVAFFPLSSWMPLISFKSGFSGIELVTFHFALTFEDKLPHLFRLYSMSLEIPRDGQEN